MVPRVTVTGTRSTASDPGTFAELFDTFLGPFADRETRFYLGGAAGVDSAALRWLTANTAVSMTVVVPCTVADQPDIAVEAIRHARDTGRLTDVVELVAATLGAGSYHARNRWMVDRSDLVIGFPQRGDRTSGTWYTLEYASELGKPRLITPLPDHGHRQLRESRGWSWSDKARASVAKIQKE